MPGLQREGEAVTTKGLRVLSALELEQMLSLVTPDKAAQLVTLADAVLEHVEGDLQVVPQSRFR